MTRGPLPLEAYVDAAWFDDERRRIFDHEWIAVARVEDLEPGSWLRVPLTPAGVLVMRDDQGALGAFHAACPHRGFPIVARDEGREQPLRCPYHGLAFALDGRACGESADLAAVRLVESHGFVFVSLGSSDFDAAVPPWLVDLPRLRRSRRVAYDVAANWKIVAENFQESLHFATVHPELEAITPSNRAETWGEGRGPWLGGIMPIVDAETVSRSKTRSGRPFVTAHRDTVHDALRFPNLLTSLQPDYLLTFLLFPMDATRTHVIAATYVDPAAIDVEDVHAFWDGIYASDVRVCEGQQRSMREPPDYLAVEEGALAFDRLVAAAMPCAPKRSSRLCGIGDRPFVDLAPFFDTEAFPELHREVTRGLAEVETTYTGGTLKWMGVTLPRVTAEPTHRDAMHAIQAMSAGDFADFLALGEPMADLDVSPAARASYRFGDETDRPFTLAQCRFLEQRAAVYFPWKVAYHLLENERWEDKHRGAGKGFSREAREVFPKTVAFIESLPFLEIGRVVVFGLLAHDHAPLHRDTEPGKGAVAQSITIAPGHGTAQAKRFFLTPPDESVEVEVDSPIYWFNDMDYHGVRADPFFRYSVRIDGVFDPVFFRQVFRRSSPAR